MDLSNKLKEARENARLTQDDVAKHLLVSRQAVSHWETGKAYPDLDNLVMISNLYNISLDSLLKGENILTQDNCAEHSSPETTDWRLKVLPEELAIAGTAVATCFIPVLGLILFLFLIGYCIIKKMHLSGLFKLILLICLLINLSNTYVYLNVEFFHFGEATIEKVASLLLNCRNF